MTTMTRWSIGLSVAFLLMVGVSIAFSILDLALPTSTPAAAQRVLDLKAGVGANKRELSIENQSGDAWWSLVITIRAASGAEPYRMRFDKTEPREQFRVDLNDFVDEEGRRFNPFTFKVQEVTLEAVVDGARAIGAFKFENGQ